MPRGGKRKGAGRRPRADAAALWQVNVRFTEDEHDTVLADAKAAGLNISDFIRSRTFRDRGAGCREV